MNLNWIEFLGKGAAMTAAPEVTATRRPGDRHGAAAVSFTATATDPDGEAGDG